jgi:hypothetical protein
LPDSRDIDSQGFPPGFPSRFATSGQYRIAHQDAIRMNSDARSTTFGIIHFCVVSDKTQREFAYLYCGSTARLVHAPPGYNSDGAFAAKSKAVAAYAWVALHDGCFIGRFP